MGADGRGAAPPGNGRLSALTMYSPLSAIIRREPVMVPLEATVRQALETMERMRIGSILVADPVHRVPLGIFTLQDHLRRVTLPGGDLQQPIAGVMTGGLITLRPQATAYQAALVMARQGVRYVVVVDDEGRLVGLVSQSDLFGLQRVGVKEVSNRIREAKDVQGLAEAAREIRGLADRLLAQGVGVETITQFIATLNDLLTIRIFELSADEFDLPTVRMCWIALGSEGRLEQTFATDQDNGLVFECDRRDADAVRVALLPFARSVNQKLAACGFPLCKGNIMAGNPKWCLSADEWRQLFSGWMLDAQPEALLHAAIFFDLRPVSGDGALADRLRGWLLATARERPVFLRFMAENALQSRPPLGLFRGFVCDRSREHRGTIDIKLHGSRPFVDAARVFALAGGVPHTSTAQRLRAVGDALRSTEEGLAAILDGYHFIHLLRLRNQCRFQGREEANRIRPRELNELDRHVLKEAFRQAQRLQDRLASTFNLDLR